MEWQSALVEHVPDEEHVKLLKDPFTHRWHLVSSTTCEHRELPGGHEWSLDSDDGEGFVYRDDPDSGEMEVRIVSDIFEWRVEKAGMFI